METPAYTTLSEDLIAEIREAFAEYDPNNTGLIRSQDLGTVMRALGFNHTEAELFRFEEELDEDDTGLIDFRPFFALMTRLFQSVHQHEHVLTAFKMFDRDGEGIITQSKLRAMFTNLGEPISDEDFEKMFNEVDIDKDGVINLKDFLEAYKN